MKTTKKSPKTAFQRALEHAEDVLSKVGTGELREPPLYVSLDGSYGTTNPEMAKHPNMRRVK